MQSRLLSANRPISQGAVQCGPASGSVTLITCGMSSAYSPPCAPVLQISDQCRPGDDPAGLIGRKLLLDAVRAGASFGIGYQNRFGTEVKAIVVRYRKVQGAAAPIRIVRTFVGAHFLELMNKTTAVRRMVRLARDSHALPLARLS